MSWFPPRPIGPGVWLVAEPGHVNCWLVAGKERAVLLDTGLGVAPIRPVVQALTPVPVEAVNSHYHFDHTGGNAEFDQVSIHEVGAPLLAAGVPPEGRAGSLASPPPPRRSRDLPRPRPRLLPPALRRQRPPPPPGRFRPRAVAPATRDRHPRA